MQFVYRILLDAPDVDVTHADVYFDPDAGLYEWHYSNGHKTRHSPLKYKDDNFVKNPKLGEIYNHYDNHVNIDLSAC